MARILYGAPESEREEDDTLVAKLRNEGHSVTHCDEWIDFMIELRYCKDIKIGHKIIPRRYDRIIYDTKLYGGNWLPNVRAENFKFGILRCFEKIPIPVIIFPDREIYASVKGVIEDFQRRKSKQ